MTRPTKYITTELFLEANAASIREKRNRNFSKENLLEQLKPNERFIICHEFLHAKGEMRIGIFIDDKA